MEISHYITGTFTQAFTILCSLEVGVGLKAGHVGLRELMKKHILLLKHNAKTLVNIMHILSNTMPTLETQCKH